MTDFTPLAEWIDVNDIVELKYPRPTDDVSKTYRVTAVKRTKLHMLDEDGKTWITAINGVRKTDRSFTEPERPPLPSVVLGSVVTFITLASNQKWGHSTAARFVVIKKSADDRVNVALLGGNNDNYVRTSLSNIRVVDATEETST